MKTLLKAVQISDGSSPHHKQIKDVLLDNNQLLKVEDHLSEEDSDQIIECKNLILTPGFFDPNVHFGEPGFEDRETISNGLQVAQQSGFSEIALVASTQPVIDHAYVMENLQQKAKNSKVKLHVIPALTHGLKSKDLAELFEMHEYGAIGFSDDDQPIKNTNLLKLALQYTLNFNGLVHSFPVEKDIQGLAQVHESPTSTLLGLKSAPSLAETLQVSRDLAVLEYTGGRLHIPLISTKESVRLIQEAKSKGLDVSCSVSINQLFFTDESLNEFDTNFKLNPPLREKSDQEALIQGVKDGIIDFVTSHHRPMNIEHKFLEFEHAKSGSIGLESYFGAMNKLFGTEKALEVIQQSRKVYGLASTSIEEGERIALNLIDPNIKWNFTKKDILSKSKNAIFMNEELVGKVIQTFY
ncbi:MAG: dihydroorotase [Flavobacteriaceae bacterium]|nr:dihydroorotase [Flavobacteriaceae bacterium]